MPKIKPTNTERDDEVLAYIEESSGDLVIKKAGLNGGNDAAFYIASDTGMSMGPAGSQAFFDSAGSSVRFRKGDSVTITF